MRKQMTFLFRLTSISLSISFCVQEALSVELNTVCTNVSSKSPYHAQISSDSKNLRVLKPDGSSHLPDGVKISCNEPSSGTVADGKIVYENASMYSLICNNESSEKVGGVYYFRILNSQTRVSSAGEGIESIKLLFANANAELLFISKDQDGKIKVDSLAKYKCLKQNLGLNSDNSNDPEGTH